MPWSRNSPACLRDFEGLTGGRDMGRHRGRHQVRGIRAFGLEAHSGRHDLGWVRRTMELLGWIAPGDLKLFTHEQLEEAKAWVAA